MKNRIFCNTLLLYTFCCTLIVQTEDVIPDSKEDLKSLLVDNSSLIVTKEEEIVTTNMDYTTKVDNVDSSFEEIAGNSFAGTVESVSQNSGAINDVTSQPVVFNLKDSATVELNQRTKLATEQPVNQLKQEKTANSTEKPVETLTETNVTNVKDKTDDGVQPEIEKTGKENLTNSEEIPSFSEWTQKQLEEAEKKKVHVNISAQNQSINGKPNSGAKLRSKNYASPDCGAKIVAANPEAVSPSSVLSPSRDEYKLNTCTSRIWFIVELCEAVQAKKIDFANFELFSSSPKEFSVSISDRFPTRDWSLVGQFTAKDERDIQSFDLYPHLFGRYMKVEVKSHYGSEHFCPISLFRVYGTSEFEVLEKEDQVNTNILEEDVDDEPLGCAEGEMPKNLFSSATDAVISIVKKAAEVLGTKGNASNHTIISDHVEEIRNQSVYADYCMTPSHTIVCSDCNETLYRNIYYLLSCQRNTLINLLNVNFIKNSLRHSGICKNFGFEFSRGIQNSSHICGCFLNSFFSLEYLGALCNAFAVEEHKVVLNVTQQFDDNATAAIVTNSADANLSEPVSSEVDVTTKQQPHELPTSALSIEDEISALPDSPTVPDVAITSQINPTKTLNSDNLSLLSEEETITVQPTDFLKSELPLEPETEKLKTQTPPVNPVEVIETSKNESFAETEGVLAESAESVEEVLEEFSNETTGMSNQLVNQHNIPVQAQKESVFLRLSNRIKALERNMSLSSQYLEELSRRYKKQMEEMQRLFDRTLNTLNIEARQKDEHNKLLETKLEELKRTVDDLIMERNTWTKLPYYFVLIVVSIVCIAAIFRQTFMTWHNTRIVEIQRRNSVDVVTHPQPQKKQRRPSEEAMKIRGSYKELMVDNIDGHNFKNGRKRKKRKESPRANSFVTLPEERGTVNNTESGLHNQELEITAPTDKDWIESNEINDVPVVLEESEHSFLDFTPLVNGNIGHSPSFMKTATKTRLNRSASHTSHADTSLNHVESKQRSMSVHETSKVELFKENVMIVKDTPKKEKKSLFKIFKKK